MTTRFLAIDRCDMACLVAAEPLEPDCNIEVRFPTLQKAVEFIAALFEPDNHPTACHWQSAEIWSLVDGRDWQPVLFASK